MNLSKSLKMQARAIRRIPGMSQLLSKRPDMFSIGVWPGYFQKAKNVFVWDLDGNQYIDMSIGGIGANVLGYADDDVDAAVLNAIKNGSSSSLNSPEEVELADLLCDLHPWAEKVRFARTGGESMAIAVRIARAYTGKDKVAFCGYHGWHDWYLSANIGTENALGDHLLSGLNPAGVPKGLKGSALPFRYNHIDALEKIVRDQRDHLAAIVMEPIRGETPKDDFLSMVRSIADDSSAVLIFDEISSGFRLNTGGAHLVLNTDPDIAVFSKGMGNGYPIAAVIGKSDVMDAAQGSFISSTMWTERIGPAAAIATINKHRANDVGSHLTKIGKQVQNGWTSAARRRGLKIKAGGIPPLSHFTFEYENAMVMKAYFIQAMLERGYLASTSFYSMFAHTTGHVSDYTEAVNSVFREIVAAQKKGTLESLLKGKPSSAGFKRLA